MRKEETDIDQRQIETIVRDTFTGGIFVSLTLSDPDGFKQIDFQKLTARPILLKREKVIQFEYVYDSKTIHRNLPVELAIEHVLSLLGVSFRRAFIRTIEADLQVQIADNGKVSLHKTASSRPIPLLEHNRKKTYILPEGQPCDFLIRLGVMTRSGKVIADRYDKFRQINRFLEMVNDVVADLPPNAPLTIVDFGCGKSYLTFALYHYLKCIRGREISILGLDRKQDVVAHCNQIAYDLDYDRLKFEAGEIKDFQLKGNVDLVVSLHACDTATDDALKQAVDWKAKVILAVPCCQHELFKQLDNEIMQVMLKHGIFRERLAALITDAARAALLEQAGYAVQVIEFIDMEHTPKNLLIRAVLRSQSQDTHSQEGPYRAFRDFWSIHPSLEKMLDIHRDRD